MSVGLDLYMDILCYTLVICYVINFVDLCGLSLFLNIVKYLVLLIGSLSAINLYFSSSFLIFLCSYFFSISITLTVCIIRMNKYLEKLHVLMLFDFELFFQMLIFFLYSIKVEFELLLNSNMFTHLRLCFLQ